jgi:cbb3-type cytochrome oxidase subunit 3
MSWIHIIINILLYINYVLCIIHNRKQQKTVADTAMNGHIPLEEQARRILTGCFLKDD